MRILDIGLREGEQKSNFTSSEVPVDRDYMIGGVLYDCAEIDGHTQLRNWFILHVVTVK